MNKINLTAKEKSVLEHRHRKTRDVRELDRIKAVLLRSEGWLIAAIAQALRIHESSVSRHLEDYNNGKLTIASGGSSSILNKCQTAELISHLEIYTYQSTQEIIIYIQDKHDVCYSIPGMNKWLHRHGFSYKKPKGYPRKADKKQQAKFIAKYNRLKKRINTDDAILFMDSCHPSMATKITHGWIKKGQSKPIKTTASRTRVNLVGAINLEKISSPMIASYTTVDGESIVDFLQQTRKYAGISGKIHLILDQAGYHRSAEVIKEAKNQNIKLHYLPPYSPNLNPIERLWKVMNEYSRNNQFFKTAQEFRQSITNFFANTLPKIASELSSRINDNFESLDYAF